MSGTFTALGFAQHAARMAVAIPAAQHHALEQAARVVRDEARREIGTYQRPGSGPFAAWQELADSTKARRSYMGFPSNRPLLVTGELRDSIQYRAGTSTAVIGSDNMIAVYQELGTPGAAHPIPARSFLGMAASKRSAQVRSIIGAVMMHLLLRGPAAGPAPVVLIP